MKRKLNEDDIPTPAAELPQNQTTNAFVPLGLDSRLLQAIAKDGFSTPTPVQTKAIPLSLEGKDILGTSIVWVARDRELTAYSPCKDWLWQNRSLCPSYIGSYTPSKNCVSGGTILYASTEQILGG